MLCMSSLSCVSSVLCVGDGLAVYEYSLVPHTAFRGVIVHDTEDVVHTSDEKFLRGTYVISCRGKADDNRNYKSSAPGRHASRYCEFRFTSTTELCNGDSLTIMHLSLTSVRECLLEKPIVNVTYRLP